MEHLRISRYQGLKDRCTISHVMYLAILLIFIQGASAGCHDASGTPPDQIPVPQDTLPHWTIGPFVKQDSANPCLLPSSTQMFRCPVLNDMVAWEVKDVFNPAVIVLDNKMHMIYRAEDSIGQYNGTSRLGLALSDDGLVFDKLREPVFYPDRDQMFQYEWEGGCEDPRIVKRADGRYVMTYTSYDGKVARLCVASSRDLRSWTKHGLAFGEGKFKDVWGKSGAIVSTYDSLGSITAAMINGKYWMYWGDKNLQLASSSDLLAWTPVLNENGDLKVVLSPRSGMFDSDLVEPGPPAMLTDAGIVLLYNSRNYGEQRDTTIAEGTYSAGQVLFDRKDPAHVIDRTQQPWIIPDRSYEIEGQVNRVVFVEGLVHWKGMWHLYYGTADSKIAAARAE